MRSGWPTVLLGSTLLCALDARSVESQQPQCRATDHPIVNGAVGARIDTALTRLEVFGYSGAVLIDKNGEIILRKAYGWADRSRGLRNTTETPFDLAAATVPFTAAAILSLAQEGKLALTDSIGQFFPELPTAIHGVTLHRLLSHTAGGPASISGAVSRDDAVRRIGAAQWAAADTSFRYSNAGYVLLAAIVDKLGGGYREYVATHVLRPLNMRNTFFRGQNASLMSCVARGYSGWRDVSNTAADTSWNTVGSRQLIGTVDDFHAWGKSWPRGLFDRHWVFNDSATFGYGGVTRLTSRGTRYLHAFSGGTPGYQSEIAAFPEDGVVWVSQSNAADADGRSIGFTAQAYMLDAMFGGNLPIPPVATIVDPNASRVIAGEYRLASGGRFVIRGSGDSLVIGAIGQDAVNTLDDGESRVRARADSVSLIRPLRRLTSGELIAWDVARGRGVRVDASATGSVTIRGTKTPPVVASRASAPAPSAHSGSAQPATVVDARDGRSYPVVHVGTQRWIAQNMQFTTPRSRCYDDRAENCDRLGRLYDWQDALFACPAGWRLATDDDWKTLERTAGVPPDSLDTVDARGAGAGDRLKRAGNLGFNAQLGGWFDPQAGQFRRADTSSALWTATESGPGRAWHRDVGNLRTSVWRSPVPFAFLLSVRCVEVMSANR